VASGGRRVRKVSAETEYGHSVLVSARISPAANRAIHVLVQSGRWQFEGLSGFIRAAIHNLIERCDSEEPGIGEFHYVNRIEQIIIRKQEQLLFMEAIDTMRRHCNEMADAGEWNDIKDYIEEILAVINGHPEGSRKQRYLGYVMDFQMRMTGLGALNGVGPMTLELPAREEESG
jgi:hypothetical protein